MYASKGTFFDHIRRHGIPYARGYAASNWDIDALEKLIESVQAVFVIEDVYPNGLPFEKAGQFTSECRFPYQTTWWEMKCVETPGIPATRGYLGALVAETPVAKYQGFDRNIYTGQDIALGHFVVDVFAFNLPRDRRALGPLSHATMLTDRQGSLVSNFAIRPSRLHEYYYGFTKAAEAARRGRPDIIEGVAAYFREAGEWPQFTGALANLARDHAVGVDIPQLMSKVSSGDPVLGRDVIYAVGESEAVETISNILYTLSLSNARNATWVNHNGSPRRDPVTRAERRKFKNLPLRVEFKTLRIVVGHGKNERIVYDGPESNDPALLKAQHLVRGHFADYPNGLFGDPARAGRYFKPAHVRGSLEAGLIEKDYAIEATR